MRATLHSAIILFRQNTRIYRGSICTAKFHVNVPVLNINSDSVSKPLTIFDNFILEMDGSGNSPLKFHVVMVDNRTFYASVIGKNKTLQSVNFFQSQPYDDTGALYYVVVVLCIYDFSIILMIGSSIKKSKQDVGVSKYMKGMDKLRKIEKRQQKFIARMKIHNNKHLAEVLERRSSERSEKSFQGSIDIIQEESESELASNGGSSTCDVNDSCTTEDYTVQSAMISSNINVNVNPTAPKLNTVVVQMDNEPHNAEAVKAHLVDEEADRFVTTDEQAALTSRRNETVIINEYSEPVFV